jgi:hypothetical protein
MKQYIGTKIIQAEPEMKDGKEGYKVTYPDGYVSWSPAETFEEAYRETTGMDFGLAYEAMRKGHKVAREGWNGKGMFIFLVPGSTFTVNRPPLLGIYPEGTEVNYHSHVDMKTADGQIVPWLCSQTDMAADDWQIIN